MYHKVHALSFSPLQVLDECLTRIHGLKTSGMDPQRIGIMVASHNEDTVSLQNKPCLHVNISPCKSQEIFYF